MEFLDTPVFREKTVKMIGVPEGGVAASDESIWVGSHAFLLFSCKQAKTNTGFVRNTAAKISSALRICAVPSAWAKVKMRKRHV